ncbi:MAG: aldehyde ferredoxin oxidoreductase family protein [Candidatus Odinarchaeota archaeon]
MFKFKSNGFFGKILWVNLSEGTFKEEELPEEIYRQYIGGYGLAAKLIYDNMPAKIDPLGSESIFGFFPGLLTGTVAPLTGRFMVAGKSPLTGTWGDANSGGFFGPEIKKCGYDGILIKGIADGPKYIAIIDNEKQILDASYLWGLDTVKTEDKLKEKYGSVRTASIGQSGEKLSLISGVVNDKGRIAARSGFGAVMGSKKLKALVLKGNKKISIAKRDELTKYSREYNECIKAIKVGAIHMWKTIGTSWLNEISGVIGDAPIKNWGGNTDEDFSSDRLNKISGEKLNEYKQKEFGCFSCSVQCGGIMKVPELGLEETHLPEYETCAAFGHLLLNDDLMSLFTLNDLCNRAGIDTISVGGTVAFAIECFMNGIINKDDTGGLELTWGNSKAIIEIVKMIIKREGIGDILADGSKRASEKIGKGSGKYAMHSIGQDLPMHDPKHYNDLGLTYAFDPTPGRHTAANLDMASQGPFLSNSFIEGFILPKRFKRSREDRSEALRRIHALCQTRNCLGLCITSHHFITYPLRELIKAVVGWNLSIEEIIKTGLRIQTLRQAFTLREGVILAKNELPGRAIGDPPFESGPHKRKTIDYKNEYKAHCKKMGWNPENGYPLKETLSALNLDFVIKDLY